MANNSKIYIVIGIDVGGTNTGTVFIYNNNFCDLNVLNNNTTPNTRCCYSITI